MAIINGTPGDDTLEGTEDPDVITGFGGDDYLIGYGGDDILDGGDDNDTLIGNAGDDTLYGGDGHDFLYGDISAGEAGNDAIYGGSGDDFMRGYLGDDILDGADGYDRVSFFLDTPTTGVTVDLNIQGVAQDTGHGLDTLVGIEHVSGTIFDDTIIGDGGDNWLWGGSDGSGVTGNDTISGGAGNDLIEVGTGNHTLDGGDGIDTLSLFGNGTDVTPDGVTVDLSLQGSGQNTEQGTMLLTGFENLSGSIHADVLIGDSGANWIGGDQGDDSISGGDGNDMLYGDGRVLIGGSNTNGSGPIAFYASTSDIDPSLVGGDDVIEGGLGDDIIDGGEGNDTASYANASGSVTVFLDETIGFADGADGNDTLYNIENATGSAFDDQLIGNSIANILSGGAGNDNVRGRGGDDILNGDDGHDFMVGGDGNDTLSGDNDDDYLRGGEGDDVIDGGAGYDRAAFTVGINNPSIGETGVQTGATVDLNLQGTAQDTGHGMDTLTGIEHVSGTTYNDTLIGDANDNWIWGEGGDDDLQGGGGNDLIETDSGNSVLDGGSGVDTASFNGLDSFTSGVSVSLALQGAAQRVAPGSSITLTNFENLTGTLHDDALTGDDGANVLAGNAGNDTLSGGKGDDTLYGDGAIRPDTHGTGGSGPITTFTDVSVAFGSAPGNDALDGGKGDDTLYGGGGDDVMTGGQGSDTFVIEANSGNDTITDFHKNQDLIVFDIAGVDDFGDLTLTAMGNDTLITWGSGDSLFLEGVKANQLSASSFDFGASAAAAEDFGLFG